MKRGSSICLRPKAFRSAAAGVQRTGRTVRRSHGRDGLAAAACLGRRSIRSRGDVSIISGQEYRSTTYGHLNLFLLDELVFAGGRTTPTIGPLRRNRPRGPQPRRRGLYAHGGYAQEIYADVAQDSIDGVELLQFGVYRGIGLDDWYHMLSAGFRVPASGACDYPACRKLGDAKTYVYLDEDDTSGVPQIERWLRGMAAGQSFVTTGPILLLEVDGLRPGGEIRFAGDRPRRVSVRVRVRSEVAPVTNVEVNVGGRVAHALDVPKSRGQGSWLELQCEVELSASTWIAARAYSLSDNNTPDAESHTNPVYVYMDGRAPYERASLDRLVEAVDGQIARHKARQFAEQARVIDYFERSRDILLRIREVGGAPADGHPSQLAGDAATDFDAGARTHSDEELEAFLQPVPPKTIDEALASFETVDGLEMQLVAAEPLVNDPIAAAFDEDGNLYVCEMRDYPYKPAAGNRPIGSVRLLRDVDDDGVFDTATLFADELLWAGGVAPWQGGVFVAAPPDIWYMKDTDGDGVADLRERVYTGFGTGNQQAMLNNLTWGLDHKIYGSTAGNGGNVQHVGHDEEAPVAVDGHDFRFSPREGRFESITGTVQFGTTFDDWGNRFLCSQSQPLRYAALPERYLRRNPYLPVPSAVETIVGDPTPIFRISPLEHWRMIRSSRRIAHGARSPDSSGASHHVVDAAAGVTVYRGGAYPASYYGQVFVGDGQNNLVHRRSLVAGGLSFRSERVDEGTEVVRSSDIWFRPVNFVNAPDGTLYVLDMCREVLETIHVPLDVTKFLDFKSGRDRGRVYRLAPTGYAYPGLPHLHAAGTDELVAALESPHGWWRDTAHRLIYERQDAAAVAPLRTLLRGSAMPQARLCALWSLAGLDELNDDDLLAAMNDAHFALVVHAMRLAESRLDGNTALLRRVIELAAADDIRLRQQAAYSLGESRDPRATEALSRARGRRPSVPLGARPCSARWALRPIAC
ncbi:MAG: CehA/McbA family metallohydrolase [Pirellulales bacterium]